MSGTAVTRVASNTDYGCWVVTVRRLGEVAVADGPRAVDVPVDVRAALAQWLAEADLSPAVRVARANRAAEADL